MSIFSLAVLLIVLALILFPFYWFWVHLPIGRKDFLIFCTLYFTGTLLSFVSIMGGWLGTSIAYYYFIIVAPFLLIVFSLLYLLRIKIIYFSKLIFLSILWFQFSYLLLGIADCGDFRGIHNLLTFFAGTSCKPSLLNSFLESIGVFFTLRILLLYVLALFSFFLHAIFKSKQSSPLPQESKGQ